MGATSGIGLQLLKLYIRRDLVLGIAARNAQVLEQLSTVSEGRVYSSVIDVCADDAPEKLLALIEGMGGLDLYIHSSGQGFYNPELDASKDLATVHCNVEGFVRCIDTIYAYFAKQGSGHIAAISSVAGTKGLGMAASYSSSKAFQQRYLQSLRQLSRVKGLDICVTDIQPGFVDTPLLKQKSFPLLMPVERVADEIIKAIDRRKRTWIIDWRYRLLVFGWKLLPNWLWERLRVQSP